MTTPPNALTDKTSSGGCIRGLDYVINDRDCIWITGTNGATVRIMMNSAGQLELYTINTKHQDVTMVVF